MAVAVVEQRLVGVAHEFGLRLAGHDLEIDRLHGVVGVAVDDAGRAGDAVPRAERHLQTPAVFLLEEHRQMPLQHEEHLLDLVRMGRVALARRHVHDAQGERPRRDRRFVGLAAGVADEAVLRPPVAVDQRVREGRPVGLAVGEPGDVTGGDLLQPEPGDFGRAGVARGLRGHGRPTHDFGTNALVK